MAISTITYSNKVALNENSSVADINKVKADDMNEIKTVVNNNATETSNNTTDISKNTTDIANITGTILWTNPNPTSDFASQTITLSSDDYDMLEIIYITFNTNNQTSSVKILKGYNTRLITSLSSGTVYTRDYTYNSDTSYTIGNTTGGNDSNLYPLYIIGYKTGLFS